MWVLTIAFTLRLTWVLAWPNDQSVGDYIWLNERAKELAAGRGYVQGNGQPTAFWPIGYPLTLSLLYRVFGPHDLAGKLANVACSMGILAGTYLLGRRLFSETSARLGLLLLAVSPNQIAYNSLLATEPLFTMLFMAALVIAFARTQDHWTGLALGTALGLACNVKPVTLGLFPLFFACLWGVRRDWKQAAIHTAIALGVASALLTPWVLRNHSRFGKWLLTNEAGLVLLVGNNPGATGQYHRAPIIAEIYPKLQQGGQAEYEWNKKAQALALQFIRDHPGRFLKLGLKKLYHMYKHDADGIWFTLDPLKPRVSEDAWYWKTLTRTSHLHYALVMLMALGSLTLSPARERLLSIPNLCWLFVFYFSFVCFLFHGLPRYHYPIMPLLCLFGAHFAAMAFQRNEALQVSADLGAVRQGART